MLHCFLMIMVVVVVVVVVDGEVVVVLPIFQSSRRFDPRLGAAPIKNVRPTKRRKARQSSNLPGFILRLICSAVCSVEKRTKCNCVELICGYLALHKHPL